MGAVLTFCSRISLFPLFYFLSSIFSRRAPQVMNIEFLSAFLDYFLRHEFDILRGFDPTLKIGDRTAVGCNNAQHLTNRKFADRLAALDERHWALRPFDIERLVICLFHDYGSFRWLVMLLRQSAHILAELQFFRFRLGRCAQTDVDPLDFDILRRELRQIAENE